MELAVIERSVASPLLLSRAGKLLAALQLVRIRQRV